MIRWIGAVLGYLIFRFPGALLGFAFGYFIEMLNSAKGKRGRSSFEPFYTRTVSPADFELNLLSLCALVIKADGEVNPRELDYVRRYFVSTYGKEQANAVFRTFNEVIKNREVSAQKICAFLRMGTGYEVRLQLLHFLFNIAAADGIISPSERTLIAEIASYLNVFQKDYESIRAMFIKEGDDAYKILEIDRSASTEEIKRAYRTMVKKYHPDKVQSQDEAIRKGAEEKFKEVQRAYEQLQKERRF